MSEGDDAETYSNMIDRELLGQERTVEQAIDEFRRRLMAYPDPAPVRLSLYTEVIFWRAIFESEDGHREETDDEFRLRIRGHLERERIENPENHPELRWARVVRRWEAKR